MPPFPIIWDIISLPDYQNDLGRWRPVLEREIDRDIEIERERSSENFPGT